MRIYREYACDFGHRWTVLASSGDPEAPVDTFCDKGHEAVTLTELEPADEVQIVFRPATKIADRITGKVQERGQYYLVLMDRLDAIVRTSVAPFSWDDAVRLALRFRGLTRADACKRWDKRPL